MGTLNAANEVAKAAQVSKGSFYSYFDSKEAFAVETISHYISNPL
jgi:TetR/AcrR family transcriptional repressor of nem operon